MYKINVEAAIQVEIQIAGLGAVVRDCNGKIVIAVVKTVSFRGEIRFSKAEAVEWGLKVVIDAKMPSVIVEMDCQEVANLINKKQSCRTKFFCVVMEFKACVRILLL